MNIKLLMLGLGDFEIYSGVTRSANLKISNLPSFPAAAHP
jgi:hypothetical protein